MKFLYQMTDEDEMKMMNEVKILNNIDHPCVNQFIECVDTRDILTTVMEFNEGGDLEKFVNLERLMGRLSEHAAKFQFYQISHAVAYLHSKNICHRNLKLSNVLMSQPTAECLLKISDFSISKMWNDKDLLRTKVGTPGYMAPEVLLASPGSCYTSKADCWALGIILYHLLSGREPHNCRGQTDGPDWDRISDCAKNLVKRLLVSDPEERFKSSGILQHSWFVSDPNTCNRSRNMMFQTENSLNMPSASFLVPQTENGEMSVDSDNFNASDRNNPSSRSSMSSDQMMVSSKSSTNSDENSDKSNSQEETESSKKVQTSDSEDKTKFENIKSRLRPRSSNFNYFKSNVVPSTVSKSEERKSKRKGDEIKQVAFMLPNSKRRRRNSEHYLKLSYQDHVVEISDKKNRRNRRKSGI